MRVRALAGRRSYCSATILSGLPDSRRGSTTEARYDVPRLLAAVLPRRDDDL